MKRVGAFVRFAVVMVTAFLVVGAVRVAPYGDVGVSVSGVAGDVVTILVHNPTPEPAAAEVRITVQLDDNSSEALTSSGVYLAPGETVEVEVQASRTVSLILEGPEPFPI